MEQSAWQERESAVSLGRLLPRLRAKWPQEADKGHWLTFERRLRQHFPRLFARLHALYGGQYDFFYHLEAILDAALQAWVDRPEELKALDALREAGPRWYQSQRMIGAMAYVDLFAGTLAGVRERIPYLRELGITYLHLMPLFKAPEGDNDGGYAVSSYREVDPALGRMEELEALARELRQHGISLCLDFVFNHTSDEHDWARQALAGDEPSQRLYWMFPDRALPDAYERTLPEIFPDEHPGAFSYRSRVKKWIWTTFHTYQWDLNYSNPEVFQRMAGEMLGLANRGVELLRLDAVAFIWKRMGTDCQNLPEAHTIIQAFNALVSVVAPAMVFKSEAIVHPDEVAKYIGLEECPLSYNPNLMALLWEALATRDVRVLSHSLRRRFALPEGCAWVNYARCHDDIGWAFSNDDIAAFSYGPDEHRRFLTRFYTGQFEGSFARGEPFQENPKTGDARVSGTCASLTGLEKGLEAGDAEEVEMALRRILLIHGVIFTIGGIPLLYLGDELATLNDHSYEADDAKMGDSRWLHRAPFDPDRAEQRSDASTPSGRVFQGIQRLVQLRNQTLAFDGVEADICETGNRHVFGYFRNSPEQGVLVLGNFSDEAQALDARRLRMMGLRKTVIDLLSGRSITAARELELEPYELLILMAR